ncbi:hypothetical protein Q4I28_007699 [Leishmania naiffi]|uniref:Uncharacterized protein n=1 Tax=Leishmania naiffi TaxID=5678 RepID=A0AAW3B866_9TRYP
MSLTTVDDRQRDDVVHLRVLLQKREYHLAELINEVVYAEQERYKAVQEASSLRELVSRLEDIINKLLEYHMTIHKEVLLPALIDSAGKSGDAHSVRAPAAEGFTVVGSSKDVLDDLLGEPRLSSETKNLVQGVLQQKRKGERLSSSDAELHGNSSSLLAALSNAAPSRQPADAEASVDHARRRAIVLSSSLLQNQEELVQLLRSIRIQTEDLRHHWDRLRGVEVQDRQQPLRESTVRQQKPISDVAPFRLENLRQHSNRTHTLEEALRSVEKERDALRVQLRERNAAAAAALEANTPPKVVQPDESWHEEMAQLKKELAYAQQRVLQEQARNQGLKKQVSQLEKVAAASPITSSATSPTTCVHCEKTRADMHNQSSDFQAAKTTWKEEERRLKKEIASLRLQVKEPVNKTSLPLPSPPVGALTDAPQCYASGTTSERKIGHLEATVASTKADLQIMEMRMAVMQSEWDSERRRILAAHEQERRRLCDERDECQRIIDKMSLELQALSQMSSRAPLAIPSIAG